MNAARAARWAAGSLAVLAAAALALGLGRAVERTSQATLQPPGRAEPVRGSPAPPRPASPSPPPAVLETTDWAGGLLTVTVRVAPSRGDYLFEAPCLVLAGRTYPPTADSLLAARRAGLSGAGALLRLVFAGVEPGRGELLLNPGSAADNPVSPQVAVPVDGPARGGEARTP